MIRLNATIGIPARYMNRHCLITGGTGTGKTVTVKKLIESLAQAGTPCIAPDVKGDFAPIATAILSPGDSLRVPVWAMGADLLGRALELSEAQAGALEIAFAHASATGAPLDSLSDLRDLLGDIAAQPESVAALGYVTRASVGTIQRALLRLESQGQGGLFGAPGFDIASAMQPGAVSVIDASRLYHSPRLYGALSLYLLRELATRFPECGDLDKPRLALVIDEAHSLFSEASPALVRSAEATARLIRSKGVALVFASQSPGDVPPVIAAQCATTIQHGRELGVGNARFVTLDSTGAPTAPRVIRPDLPAHMLRPDLPARDPAPVAAEPAPMRPDLPAPEPAPVVTESDIGDATRAANAFLAILALVAFALGYALG